MNIEKADKESLKAELAKLKDREAKLRLQSQKHDYTETAYLIAGQQLTPHIYKVAQNYAIRRTHTGKFKVHGRTYRTKKLAEKAWKQDAATLFNIGYNRKTGKRSWFEELTVMAGNFTFFGFPQIMKGLNEYSTRKSS